jgi:hypothetical protein
MLTIYFAQILDHQSNAIIDTPFTATAKHSAFNAIQYIDNCPPAMTFRICKRMISSKEIASLLNGR